MKARKNSKKLGKKAFIGGAIVDIWAYIIFLLVVLVFYIIFKISAASHEQALTGMKDLSYGNYLAGAYLRAPIDVAGTEMTMAELIALYDYNQSLEKAKGTSFEELDVFSSPERYIAGMNNPVRQAVMGITEGFIEENFREGECYSFIINGNTFRFADSRWCGIDDAEQLIDLLSEVGIPKENYVSYIPSVDPRMRPIEVYCIYDLQSLVKSLSEENRKRFARSLMGWD